MLQLMKLGFYGTRLTPAAARLFKVSSVGNMAGRGMQSRSFGNSANRSSDWTGNNQGQPPLWHAEQRSYEEEFPSHSSSITSNPKGKRRTRIDLGNSSEQKQKEIENIVTLQWERSTSNGKRITTVDLGNFSEQKQKEIENNVTLQPGRSTSSPHKDTNLHMERYSPGRNMPWLPQTHHGHGETKRSSLPSTGVIKNKPFDICLPGTGQHISLGSSVTEEHGGDRAQKVKADVQSVEEDDKTKDNVQSKGIGLVLGPGMVLFKSYISLHEQVNIVNKCRELGCGPGGFYRPGYNDGAKLRLYMMCLGLDWNPQTRSYGQMRHHDNVVPPAIPHEFTSIVSRVLEDSHTLIKRDLQTLNPEEVLPTMTPDVCIVNFYTTAGRLGLHQDRDESVESLNKGLPVISISIGDSAQFLFGNERDADKAASLKLESGDVLVFGGESRHVFHGVKSIIPDTAPLALREITNLLPGRLNLTFRNY